MTNNLVNTDVNPTSSKRISSEEEGAVVNILINLPEVKIPNNRTSKNKFPRNNKSTNNIIDSDVNVITKNNHQSKQVMKESSLLNASKEEKSTSIYQNTTSVVNEFDTIDGAHATINPRKKKKNITTKWSSFPTLK